MIGFHLARIGGDEAALARHSLPEADVLDRLDGRTVAIVGNARALADTAQGARIDAADLVIRLNAAPIPDARSHGMRTDWLAMSTPVPGGRIAARGPSLILWMTPKRKRLPWRIARDPRFFLNPRESGLDLAVRLGASATTGALAIDLVSRSPARAIALHGFDFFASKSLSGRRDASRVPHDFEAECLWVQGLHEADPRLEIVPVSESR